MTLNTILVVAWVVLVCSAALVCSLVALSMIAGLVKAIRKGDSK